MSQLWNAEINEHKRKCKKKLPSEVVDLSQAFVLIEGGLYDIIKAMRELSARFQLYFRIKLRKIIEKLRLGVRLA